MNYFLFLFLALFLRQKGTPTCFKHVAPKPLEMLVLVCYYLLFLFLALPSQVVEMLQARSANTFGNACASISLQPMSKKRKLAQVYLYAWLSFQFMFAYAVYLLQFIPFKLILCFQARFVWKPAYRRQEKQENRRNYRAFKKRKEIKSKFNNSIMIMFNNQTIGTTQNLIKYLFKSVYIHSPLECCQLSPYVCRSKDERRSSSFSQEDTEVACPFGKSSAYLQNNKSLYFRHSQLVSSDKRKRETKKWTGRDLIPCLLKRTSIFNDHDRRIHEKSS